MEQKQKSEKNSPPIQPLFHSASLLTDYDIYLFKQGNHCHLYEKLGAHLMTVEGLIGTLFAVWAPNAEQVSVIGDFNHWNPGSHPLRARKDESGIWEGFVPGVGHGALYKYHLISRHHRHTIQKGDPFAFFWEVPPRTASVVWDLGYDWQDQAWMTTRSHANALTAPLAIYEFHPGSWKQRPEKDGRFLTYRELAHDLAEYIKETGFTHVQLLPVMEHPFYGSWGYQTVGYFAPTCRFGTPQDFMAFVDYLHQQGIGVILDWVPSHFPADEHGLFKFDGTHLYEHADVRKGFHPDWKSAIFNYGRQEVRSFLISSAVFWLKQYHTDGLRADAVASMLYLDYSRQKGEWIPNEHGGRENLEAIAFLKQLNETTYGEVPDTQTIAEESTAWPMVSKPTYLGGLGFGMKWNMGWMHDTLKFFSMDPLYRKYHYDLLTFSLWYAFSENFILPLSHDEVVHGKGSLIGKMPGDEWQRFANLRLLFGLMYGQPGKKLLFMGAEFGQIREWSHEEGLEWHILGYPYHRGIQRWVRDLNRVYRSSPPLYEIDSDPEGFEWIDFQDREQGVFSFIRKGKSTGDLVFVVCNFTPVIRNGYRIGIPGDGFWREILNSDAEIYGGSGCGNFGGVTASPIPAHGRPCSLVLTLPPLGVLFFSGKASPLSLSQDNGYHG